MINLHHITKSFGGRTILKNLDLDIPDGARLCIVGGSGSGKSVLLKIILGIEKPDAGEVWIDGTEATSLNRIQWQQILQSFGVVFQGSALFDSLTIFENIGLRLLEARQIPLKKIREQVVTALEEVGLSDRILTQYPAELSGGMKKRVAIARAVMGQPRYLVYDEPTTGLDPVSSQTIDSLMANLGQNPDRTSIIVTHDMYTVKTIATQVIMIYNRGIGFAGSARAFFESEQEAVQQFLVRTY